jgi:hypothetical protein
MSQRITRLEQIILFVCRCSATKQPSALYLKVLCDDRILESLRHASVAFFELIQQGTPTSDGFAYEIGLRVIVICMDTVVTHDPTRLGMRVTRQETKSANATGEREGDS